MKLSWLVLLHFNFTLNFLVHGFQFIKILATACTGLNSPLFKPSHRILEVRSIQIPLLMCFRVVSIIHLWVDIEKLFSLTVKNHFCNEIFIIESLKLKTKSYDWKMKMQKSKWHIKIQSFLLKTPFWFLSGSMPIIKIHLFSLLKMAYCWRDG